MGILDKFFKRNDKPQGREIKPVNLKDEKLSENEKIIARMNGIRMMLALEKKKQKVDIAKKFFTRSIDGVVDTEGKHAIQGSYAMDSACCSGGSGQKINPQSNAEALNDFLMGTETFIGWQMCALLCQNWIMNKGCLAPAQDALSSGYRYISYSKDNGKDSISTEKLRAFYNKAIFDYKFVDVAIQSSFCKRQYGGSITIPVVEGADYSKPFDINEIKPNSFRGARVIEPFWMTYEFEDGDNTNAMNLGFYNPTYYVVGGTEKIHRSWVVKIINMPIGDTLKPMYYFLGIPTPQVAYERIYCFNRIANEAPLLAMTKRLTVVDADIENAVANPEYAKEMLDAIVQFRDNFGVLVKSPENNAYQIDTTLTDFDMLVQKQAEIVAAIFDIPLDRVVKTSSKNANSGGVFQENEYKQTLRKVRTYESLPIIDFLTRIMLKSDFGITERLGIEFNPLDVPTEFDKAKTQEVKAMTYAHLQSLGNISSEEVRTALRADPESGFTWLSMEVPESPFNLEEEAGEESNNPDANEEKKQAEGNARRYQSMGMSNAVKAKNADKDKEKDGEE